MKSFASDNYSSVGSEIMQYLSVMNKGHAIAYGDDEHTHQAMALIQAELKTSGKVIFVFNGTAANTLALTLCAKSYHSIICSDCSHLYTHEVNAPVSRIGAKLVLVPHHHGKISAQQIEQAVLREKYWGRHNNLPYVVSIAQATEFGTVYSLQELHDISTVCKQHDLLLHIDGCRIYNAAVSLQTELADIVTYADIISLGGTKNGLMFGEAVVILNERLNDGTDFLQKQLLQLDSKMRYLSAQFIPFFKENLWQRYASHANSMSAILSSKLSALGFSIVHPVQTNQIFVTFPLEVIQKSQNKFPYYIFDQDKSTARLVTSFDSTEEDIDAFINLISEKIE